MYGSPTPPLSKRARVILNTDAKNEADDQYAIVHAILTPSFDLHGIISAHFGTRKSSNSQRESHQEILKLLELMNMPNGVPVRAGAPRSLPDEATPVPSEGSALIIAEAMKDDPRPLHVAFLGPLTDMASALLEEPAIAERNVVVVWIGGAEWPVGGSAFNLSNDIHAANVVFRSTVQLWQIPSTVYKRMAVSYAELATKVYDKGAIGKYLVDQLVEWNAENVVGPIEYRSLGDSPAVGVIMHPDCGIHEWRPAPEFTLEMNYRHTGRNRPIRVYESVDQRFIHEDFFAKLARFSQAGSRHV
jgi:inosine-uridine nucleoside N-ribohydrolase